MAKKTALSVVREALEGGFADQISRKKNGNILLRRGYFYTNGKTEEDFEKRVLAVLHKANVSSKVVDIGNNWAPFKGGASIARQSHWWVELEVFV